MVKLDQIDLVDLQAFERAANLRQRGAGGALARLGGQEERPPVALDPVAQPQLGLAVAGGCVHVVDTIAEGHVHGGVGFGLRHVGEGGRAQEEASAGVGGAAEGGVFDWGHYTLF